jgi:hypothetical protein
MEDTCHFETCKFAKEFFEKPEECFNYKETWWKPLEGEPILHKDCAPIRTMIMVQEHYNRLIGLEKAQEQQRNESKRIMNVFEQIVNQAQRQQLQRGAIIEIGK